MTSLSTNSVANLPSKSSPSKEVNTNIPLLSCSICKHTEMEAKQMRSHYMRVHSCDVTEDDIIGLTKSGFSNFADFETWLIVINLSYRKYYN